MNESVRLVVINVIKFLNEPLKRVAPDVRSEDKYINIQPDDRRRFDLESTS